MSRTSVAIVVAGVFVALAGVRAQQPSALKTPQDIRSYALGMDLGTQFRSLAIEIDPNLVAKGLADALGGGKTLMTEADAKSVVAHLQSDLRARQFQARTAFADPQKAEEKKKAAEAFLAQNKAKPGVITRPSGLQYKIIQPGDGRKPTLNDTIVCQYRGTLVDGTEFENTYTRNAPATFPVHGVIPAWIEALQLMSPGAKWQLVVPPELGYGSRGAGDKIGPNEALIYEIELIDIK